MINSDQIKDIQARISELYKYLQIEKKKIEVSNDEEKTLSGILGSAKRSGDFYEATTFQKKVGQ
mgnify:CR=1 FL=1